MNWKDYYKSIINPPSEHRAAPFWSWNADMQPAELRRQINLMHEMGFGGAFMHSRVGLQTPYLSKQWFECIDACVDESKKNGMFSWLYDEDRWPSGAAGGLVTKDMKYRIRCLKTFFPEQKDVKDEEGNYYFAVTFSDEKKEQLKSYRKLVSKDGKLKKGETFCLIQRCIGENNPWYNGQAYLDTMNPDAVKKFIEVTHETYRKHNRKAFGKTIPGIFTDEPNYNNIGGTAWTDAMPKLFLKRYGYKIEDRLPELFWWVGGKMFSKVRLDHRNLATELFAVNFNKQIYDWCESNGIKYTGHMLGEDILSQQTNLLGAAMRQYEYMHQPGIDLLTEHWVIFNTAKQCSSVAHQFGRDRRLTETYGCTGWDFPFMGHKALSDWQFALGINFRVPHLAWYSMEAQAKRDYPACINYQSPWAKYYREVEDVLSRTSAATAPGEEVRDLLVVHPIESEFGVFAANWQWAEKDYEFEKVVKTLLTQHMDFDYGDEDIMARHASVADGKVQVKKASYKAVLLPEMLTIRASTLKLLSDFAKAGGIVCYLGNVPEFLDGVPSAKIAKAYGEFTSVTLKNMTSKLSIARRVSVKEDGKAEAKTILYLLKQHDLGKTLFLCNVGFDYTVFPSRNTNSPFCRERNYAANTTISLKVDGNEKFVYELDLSNGKIYPVNVVKRQVGKVSFNTRFEALESKLYLFLNEPVKCSSGESIAKLSEKHSTVATLPTKWNVECDDPNVVVLDQVKFSVNGTVYPKDYILTIDRRIRRVVGVPERGGHMVQPWVAKQLGLESKGKVTDVSLIADFQIQDAPKKLELALEHPEFYTITLNGKKVDNKRVTGWWVDICIQKINLPVKLLKQGENTLVLTCKYHGLLPGLEAMYLLGDFSVKGNAICAPVCMVSNGSIVRQGFPNYAGNMIYSNTFAIKDIKETNYFIEVSKWRGVSLAYRLNGSQWFPIPFPPFRGNVTNLLKQGENTLEIRILGSRRNAFGPFYMKGVDTPPWCGPAEFDYFQQKWRNLVPFGLLGPVKILKNN